PEPTEDCLSSSLTEAWSPTKARWCCQSRQIGCPTTSTPAETSYDCRAGVKAWQRGWSAAKKAWCCEHAGFGCSQDLDLSEPSETEQKFLMGVSPEVIQGEGSEAAAASKGFLVMLLSSLALLGAWSLQRRHLLAVADEDSYSPVPLGDLVAVSAGESDMIEAL
ncbi:unnamed protein product, partial [Polarella glacialis]